MRAWAAAVATLLLAACTPVAASWERVELPDGVRARSLAVAGADVLVGGRSAAAPAPRLLLVSGGRVRELGLDPADPTAATADLASLTVAGDDVYAIGTVVSGAHSNPRLTVWDGTLSRGRLASHPQEFFTFGGHDAGPVLGTVVPAGRPVIVGSRVGERGPFGLLWTSSGDTWHQQPAPPVLASAPDRVLGFGAVATLGARIVLVGDELGLAGGLTSQAVLFAGTTDGGWRASVLPLSEGPAVAGQPARATGVSCGTDACWVAGWGHGRPLAWPVSLDAAGSAVVGPVAVLAGEPAEGNAPTALVALLDGRPLVLADAAVPSVQYGCASGWRTLATPPGRASALVAAGGSAWAVVDGALWRLAVPSC